MPPRRLPWPADLGRIVDEIGEDAALRLVDEFGGTRINLPKHPTERTQLGRMLGVETAGRLVALMGWGEFLVPTCAAVKKVMRDEAIRQDTRAGMSTAKLARKYRCHDRTIRRARAKD